MEFATLNMDTYKVVQLLQDKGYTQEEAEGFIEAIQEITLTGVATKEDIRNIEKEIKHVETGLNTTIQSVETSWRTAMQEMKTDLTKLIYINTIATIGILTAVIGIAASIVKL